MHRYCAITILLKRGANLRVTPGGKDLRYAIGANCGTPRKLMHFSYVYILKFGNTVFCDNYSGLVANICESNNFLKPKLSMSQLSQPPQLLSSFMGESAFVVTINNAPAIVG